MKYHFGGENGASAPAKKSISLETSEFITIFSVFSAGSATSSSATQKSFHRKNKTPDKGNAKPVLG